MAQIRTRAWLDGAPYPELSLPEIIARPNVGLCLSGGGTRATCAAMGFLRGFHELGLLQRFRYVSAVSGGSWAMIPYCYYERGASNDLELLGPILAPEQLDRAALVEAPMPASYLGTCATQSFRDELMEELREVGAGSAWVSAAGETFLQPFGLFDSQRPRSYTWSEATRDDILARQAELPGHGEGQGLAVDDFVCVRPGRPYPIVSASLLGSRTSDQLERLDPTGFEFTPLYAGLRQPREVSYAYLRHGELREKIGGGYVEPFALGGAGPGWMADQLEQDMVLERPERLSELAFAVGASSCAYATVMAEKVPAPRGLVGRVPTLRYWAPGAGNVASSSLWELGDGGVIDNFGIYALLQREVETIVVLVNTKQKLSVDWTPGEGSYQPHIDPYIPPMFGIHEQRGAINLQRNQVFPTHEFEGLVTALQAAKLDDGPLIVVREHELVDNEWWGIQGGRRVRVCWVYLDRVPAFEAALPSSTTALINLGNAALRSGPLQGFPNYQTIGANFLSLVRFTPAQVRLLANLCSWMVLERRALFEDLF